MQTGRAGFFHRSWGPMEPFDRSFTGVLREKGVHTRLVTDHYDYFREGGSHYNTRFDTWSTRRSSWHHPDHAGQAGSRRTALTQTIDIMPTIVDIFGGRPPSEAARSS